MADGGNKSSPMSGMCGRKNLTTGKNPSHDSRGPPQCARMEAQRSVPGRHRFPSYSVGQLLPSQTCTRTIPLMVTVMVPTGFTSVNVLTRRTIPSGERMGVAVAARWTSAGPE